MSIQVSSKMSWLEPSRQIISNLLKSNSFPHALLLHGQTDLSIEKFAHRVAAQLLCQNRNLNEDACGQCKSCILLSYETHPDYHVIESAKNIEVEKVKESCQKLVGASSISLCKVLLLASCDQLNQHGFNALLKSLEEPPPMSIIILVSHDVQLLPDTLKSRCYQLYIRDVATSDITTYLGDKLSNMEKKIIARQAYGSVQRALKIQKEGYDNFWLQIIAKHHANRDKLLASYKTISDQSLDTLLLAGIECVMDLIRYQDGLTDRLININYIEHIAKLAQNKLSVELHLWLDELYQTFSLVFRSKIALNKQLLYEQFLIKLFTHSEGAYGK